MGRPKTPSSKRLVIYHVQAKQFLKNWAKLDDEILLKFQLVTDLLMKNKDVNSRSTGLAELIKFCYDNRFLLVKRKEIAGISNSFYNLWTATHQLLPNKSSEIFEVSKMNQEYQCPPFISNLFKGEQSFDYDTSDMFSLTRTQETEFNRGYPLFFYALTGQQYLEEKLKNLTKRPIRLV
jgi:hypothetical protein